jgi:hypothetical protein
MTDVVERRAQSARPRTPGRQAEPAAAVAARALDLVGEDPGAAIALAGEALVLAFAGGDDAVADARGRGRGLTAQRVGGRALDAHHDVDAVQQRA